MSKGPQRVRGTQDIFGEDAERFNTVVRIFEQVRKLYRFQRVETPVFEATQVFARSIGETTDIVSKEMYTFEDRGGDSLTLRPEFTAGICRAYLSDGWQQFAPLKLATHGPVFRYERPQKGRFRQFHQLDVEVIGAAEPEADVEVLAFGYELIRRLVVADSVTLKLNTLGDAASREAWRAALVEHFQAYRSELSEDSLARLERNPLRILDSKDPRDRSAVDSAPAMVLTTEAEDFFARVREGLDLSRVPYEIDPHLVRGLDYYRHTAFEFVTDRLGTQGTVLGGGRYDGLIETLGGPPTPAVGFAAGIERLAMLLEPRGDPWAEVAITFDHPSLAMAAQAFANVLRREGFSCHVLYRGKEARQYERIKREADPGIILKMTRDQADPNMARLRYVPHERRLDNAIEWKRRFLTALQRSSLRPQTSAWMTEHEITIDVRRP